MKQPCGKTSSGNAVNLLLLPSICSEIHQYTKGYRKYAFICVFAAAFS